MPDLVFDSSVLSNFALARALEIPKRLYAGRGFVTDHVRIEILRGVRSGHDALNLILEAVDAGWLREAVLQTAEAKANFERLSESLGLGEASCIAVAHSRELVFASDDLAARREAEKLGIPLTGTLGILKKAISTKIVDIRTADRILKDMIKKGFFSPVKSIFEIR